VIALLDTPRSLSYKPRRFVWVWGCLWATVASAEVVSGARLPEDAEKVAEYRYRTREKFEETLKFYKGVYPPASYPRRSIINQPGIKAVHIANPSKKGFLGLNIYQANDEVRIYVVTDQSKKQPNR